jgi:hypothetical protein
MGNNIKSGKVAVKQIVHLCQLDKHNWVNLKGSDSLLIGMAKSRVELN